jgi:hypothetical protein
MTEKGETYEQLCEEMGELRAMIATSGPEPERKGPAGVPSFGELIARLDNAAEQIRSVVENAREDWQEWNRDAFFYPTSPDSLVAELLRAAIEPELSAWAKAHSKDEDAGRQLAELIRTNETARRLLRSACNWMFCELNDRDAFSKRCRWLVSEVHHIVADDVLR